MKTPKPGQLCTINNSVYRAKRRTYGCEGCALNDIILCPNITDRRNGGRNVLDCDLNNIILVRVS
jgi:hypothetical protein